MYKILIIFFLGTTLASNAFSNQCEGLFSRHTGNLNQKSSTDKYEELLQEYLNYKMPQLSKNAFFELFEIAYHVTVIKHRTDISNIRKIDELQKLKMKLDETIKYTLIKTDSFKIYQNLLRKIDTIYVQKEQEDPGLHRHPFFLAELIKLFENKRQEFALENDVENIVNERALGRRNNTYEAMLMDLVGKSNFGISPSSLKTLLYYQVRRGEAAGGERSELDLSNSSNLKLFVLAVASERVDIVQELIQRRIIKINDSYVIAVDRSVHYVSMAEFVAKTAAKKRNMELLKVFFEATIKERISKRSYYDALMAAAIENSSDVVRYLITNAPARLRELSALDKKLILEELNNYPSENNKAIIELLQSHGF